MPVLVSATAAFVLTFGEHPRRAPLAPVFGMCASVLLCAAAFAFLHAPAPLTGG